MGFEKFTDRSRKVAQLAVREALRTAHAEVHPEHVLLGLLLEGSGIAASVLKNLGVDLPALRGRTAAALPTPGRLPDDKSTPPFSERTHAVFAAAKTAAADLSHNYVGTEHLLLGLLAAHPPTATAVGRTVDEATGEVVTLLGGVVPAGSPYAHFVPAPQTADEWRTRYEHLLGAVRRHAAQKADDRCVADDDALYRAAGLDPDAVDRRVGDKFEMLKNCARYIDRRCQGGGWPTYAELEAALPAVGPHVGDEITAGYRVEVGDDFATRLTTPDGLTESVDLDYLPVAYAVLRAEADRWERRYKDLVRETRRD